MILLHHNGQAVWPPQRQGSAHATSMTRPTRVLKGVCTAGSAQPLCLSVTHWALQEYANEVGIRLVYFAQYALNRGAVKVQWQTLRGRPHLWHARQTGKHRPASKTRQGIALPYKYFIKLLLMR